MSSKSEKAFLEDIRASLEDLRSKITDLEAMAHVAAEFMGKIPYLPRPAGSKPAWTGKEQRDLGRIQTFVFATASTADIVLNEINEVIDSLAENTEPDDGDDDDDNGSGSGNEPTEPDNGDDAPMRSDDDHGTHGAAIPNEITSHEHAGGIHLARSRSGGIVIDALPLPPKRP